MRITRLCIENFRSIKKLDIELSDTTVFVGPNNAGKTAILDAIRIALTRRWGQRGTGFTEYDVHLASEAADPKSSPGVAIELRTEEAEIGEWPQDLVDDLESIIQSDPITGKNSVTLRVTCAWNVADNCIQPSWAFLNAARQPLVGVSARKVNLERFWQYIPVFYLGALRDAGDEFSSRSQFWGRLLKAMEVPQGLEGRVQKVLDLLNKKLLLADPRLGKVANTLSGATRVAARDRDGNVDLRLVPLKSWDLLSKAEIILRNEPDWPWLPLQKHGQGIQSLSVIFLFRAFIEILLSDLYEASSIPVLALEEPETHLHPQAARTLWTHVNALPGQKLITTHSPYFVQHVPFRDLRLVRLTKKGTEVRWLPATFSAIVPYVPELDPVISRAGGFLTYDRAAQMLIVRGKLNKSIYRRLLLCYRRHTDRVSILASLRGLRDNSLLYVTEDELGALETFARRIRGEIFFATRWMIVEGQAEYLIVHALARCIGYDLDEHGVSVIDAMNNGYPATFAVLARALNIPWVAVFDGDEAGRSYLRAILAREFDPMLISRICDTLPSGTLEEQLLADGIEPELRQILQRCGHSDALSIDMDALKKRLADNKIKYAAELSRRIADDRAFANRMPVPFKEAIDKLKGLAL